MKICSYYDEQRKLSRVTQHCNGNCRYRNTTIGMNVVRLFWTCISMRTERTVLHLNRLSFYITTFVKENIIDNIVLFIEKLTFLT